MVWLNNAELGDADVAHLAGCPCLRLNFGKVWDRDEEACAFKVEDLGHETVMTSVLGLSGLRVSLSFVAPEVSETSAYPLGV